MEQFLDDEDACEIVELRNFKKMIEDERVPGPKLAKFRGGRIMISKTQRAVSLKEENLHAEGGRTACTIGSQHPWPEKPLSITETVCVEIGEAVVVGIWLGRRRACAGRSKLSVPGARGGPRCMASSPGVSPMDQLLWHGPGSR